jgi:predicted dienelactone hydrolase
MNDLVTKARTIPTPTPQATVTINPVTLPAPGRGRPLELRITAPLSGDSLPIILLSHGHGPSLYIPSKDGYGPLVDFYAAHGFVVIQPTHANSKVAGLGPDASGYPFFWQSRLDDMTLILDNLPTIEQAVPLLSGRLDHTRIAAVGHSLGGQTVGMLLGAGLTDTADPAVTRVRRPEPRIKAGVLLAAPGLGGDSLSDYARQNYTTLNPDFSTLTTRTLVVAGDADDNPHLTPRGADWHVDPYRHAPGAEALLTLFGGKHGLGGIAGYDAKETDDEDPDRLAVTQRLTLAWLRTALDIDAKSWLEAIAAVEGHAPEVGKVEQKQA